MAFGVVITAVDGAAEVLEVVVGEASEVLAAGVQAAVDPAGVGNQ